VAYILLKGLPAVARPARQALMDKILTVFEILRAYALFGPIMSITDHQADACKSFAL
jgi:hypothetical protein